MNRARIIPRFGIPFTAGDFFTGLAQLFGDRVPDPAGFQSPVPDGKRFWTGSGRQALWLLLKGLNLKPGSRIAVPLYTDLAVLKAIRDADYQPMFVDVDLGRLTMDPESLDMVRDRVSAVVAVHFFGHVAPLAEILEIASGLPLVEDTVHAPLSMYRGKLTGSFGVGCFYSFGSTKAITAGGGGMAIAADPDLASRVDDRTKELVPTQFSEQARNLFGQAAKTAVFSKPLYTFVGQPLRPRAERHQFLEPELDAKMIQPGQAAIALRQAPAFAARAEAYRANSLRLLSRLTEAEDVVLPWEPPETRYSYHLFPVVMRDATERDAVAQNMLTYGIDTSRIYFDIVEHARTLGYAGGCPQAEAAASRVLTLPNYAGLAENEIDRVAGVFLQALNSVRAGAASRKVVRLVPGDPKRRLEKAAANVLPPTAM